MKGYQKNASESVRKIICVISLEEVYSNVKERCLKLYPDNVGEVEQYFRNKVKDS